MGDQKELEVEEHKVSDGYWGGSAKDKGGGCRVAMCVVDRGKWFTVCTPCFLTSKHAFSLISGRLSRSHPFLLSPAVFLDRDSEKQLLWKARLQRSGFSMLGY